MKSNCISYKITEEGLSRRLVEYPSAHLSLNWVFSQFEIERFKKVYGIAVPCWVVKALGKEYN